MIWHILFLLQELLVFLKVWLSHIKLLGIQLKILTRNFFVSSQDSVLGLSKLNFDLSVYDIFGLLSCGGTLVYPKLSRYMDPSHWVELIQEYEITIWNSVPAFMQILTGYFCR